MGDNLKPQINTQDRVLNLLFEEDEITWQSILFNLVTKEEMDPWDIDISSLSERFFGMVKKLKELDFTVSGKIILASALLLRFKSSKLVDKDILELDQLIASTEEIDEEYEDLIDCGEFPGIFGEIKKPTLIPRTPQPRKRKVSIYDLVDALEQALEVRKRRVVRKDIPHGIKLPEKTKDISSMIGEVLKKITNLFDLGNKKLTFSQLIPDETKDGKVYTFIPLLHLTNQRRIDLLQQEHFGEIEIEMLKNKTLKNKAKTTS